MSEENLFSSEEREILGRVAAMIIGPDEAHDLPGADDDAILALILEKAWEAEQKIRSGVALLKQAAGDQAPSDMTPDDLQILFGKHRKDLRFFLNLMMMFTAQAYYQDVRVLRSLGQPDRPPFPLGHQVPQGDFSLVEPVRNRGEIYRKA